MDSLFTSGSATASSGDIVDPTKAPPGKYASDEELDRIIDRSIPASCEGKEGSEPPSAAKSGQVDAASGLKRLAAVGRSQQLLPLSDSTPAHHTSTLADFDESVGFKKLRDFGGVNYEVSKPSDETFI